MKNIYLEAKVLWSQIDSNNHLRHSAYADFAAQARVEALVSFGIDANMMRNYNIGPILFKEEANYFREILPNDTIKVSCELGSSREDAARWSFVQQIYRGDGIHAATIRVTGAWLDLTKRRLTIPPAFIGEQFSAHFPKSEDFEWIPKNKGGN